MQLQTARLCLDCSELHAAQKCPICASESFAYITRWVPAPERRARPRPAPVPEAETYRRLIVADALGPKAARLLRRGAVGLAAVSLARWIWRQSRDSKRAAHKASTQEATSARESGHVVISSSGHFGARKK
jgi:hypothetical protein